MYSIIVNIMRIYLLASLFFTTTCKTNNSKNTSNFIINFTKQDLNKNSLLLSEVKKHNPRLTAEEAEMQTYFMLIVKDSMERSILYKDIQKEITEKVIATSPYDNYFILKDIYGKQLLKTKKNPQQLAQDYKFRCMELKTEYYLVASLLINVNDEEMKMIEKLTAQQQSKTFKVDDDFRKSVGHLMSRSGLTKEIHLNPQEIGLQGDRISHMDFPTEFMSAKEHLHKYFVWFVASKRNKDNTWNVVLLRDIKHKQTISYQDFTNDIIVSLLKDFIKQSLKNYQINGMNPMEIIDNKVSKKYLRRNNQDN